MNELEYILKRIVEIDDKAIDLRNQTEQSVEEKKALLNEDIEGMEKKLVGDSKAELDKKGKLKIAEAQKVAESISTDYKRRCQRLRENYLMVKDRLKEQICKEMIEIS